jgi:hypothetical protein
MEDSARDIMEPALKIDESCLDLPVHLLWDGSRYVQNPLVSLELTKPPEHVSSAMLSAMDTLSVFRAACNLGFPGFVRIQRNLRVDTPKTFYCLVVRILRSRPGAFVPYGREATVLLTVKKFIFDGSLIPVDVEQEDHNLWMEEFAVMDQVRSQPPTMEM